MSAAPRVIGLDLSIAATGCVDALAEVETWKLAAKLGDGRLATIRTNTAEVVRRHGWPGVDLAVVEDLPTHAHGAGITGMVHGAVRVALLDLCVPYALVPPATLKKYATGKGNADKTAMAMALYKRTGLELANDNEVDAWWLRAMGLDHLGAAPCELPAAQRESLTKVKWPADLCVAVRTVDQT